MMQLSGFLGKQHFEKSLFGKQKCSFDSIIEIFCRWGKKLSKNLVSLWQTTNIKNFDHYQDHIELQGHLLLIQSLSLLEFLWLMIQLMDFSSNIPTHLCRQVAMFSSLDQSMSESVTEAFEATPQRSTGSSPFLETFLLCDTAVRSCFRNTQWPPEK